MRKSDYKFAEWIDSRFRFNVFATVTFKQAMVLSDGYFLRNSRDNVEATCCVIRDRVFKKLKRKYDWLTTIEEGGGEKRLHAHVAIALPSLTEFQEFDSVFLDICNRMDWVHSRIDVRTIGDGNEESRKVIFYMFKEGVDALAVHASTLSI